MSRLFFDNHKHKNQRNITDEEGGEVGELDEVDVEEDANLPELPELDPSMVSLLEGIRELQFCVRINYRCLRWLDLHSRMERL